MEIQNLTLPPDSKIGFVSDVHMDTNTPPSRIDDMEDTCIRKIEDIRDKCVSLNVKALFFEGDIFNRVSMPMQGVNDLLGEFLKFKEEGIQLFSICGNHDIMRNSMDYLYRTPIQTLFMSKALTHINLSHRVVINDSVMITPVDYTEYPPVAENFSYNIKTNILLAHMFFNANEFMSDSKHNLRTEDVLQLGYDVVILGHDHEPYPDMEIGKSLIIRHGSLLRGTSHFYNFERKPNFLVFNDLDNICKDTIERVVVSHRDYKDVVSNYIMNRKNGGSISDLKDVLSNLADKLASSSSSDEDRILEIIKSDPELPNDHRLLLLNYISEIAG